MLTPARIIDLDKIVEDLKLQNTATKFENIGEKYRMALNLCAGCLCYEFQTMLKQYLLSCG